MRRRAGFLFIFGAAAPLVILVSSAWACGVLATLKAAPSTAAAGQTVSASGVNYSDAVGTTFTPVQIRLDSRTGPVLQEVDPVNGRFNTTFQVPAVGGGDHLLIATQNKLVDGTPKAGTPGRTTMRVEGAAAGSSAPAASPWSSSDPGAPGGSAASVDARDSGYAPLLGIGLSLALLSIGVTLVARDRAARGGRPLLGG